jgi:single-strand DNA-binding protein
MRGDINRVFLSGTLIKNPEIRYNPKGNPVVTFTITFSHPSKKITKTEEEKSYIDVIALGSSLRNDGNFLQEGRKVLVNGKLKQRRWKTPEGMSRSKLELVADRIHFTKQTEEEE